MEQIEILYLTTLKWSTIALYCFVFIFSSVTNKHIIRSEPTNEELDDPDHHWQSLVPLSSESHGGEDVGKSNM